MFFFKKNHLFLHSDVLGDIEILKAMEIFHTIKDKSADIIDYIVAHTGIPDESKLGFNIRLAVEEVVVNIVNYAYPQGDGSMEVNVVNDGKELIIELRDYGIPFDPLKKPDPDITLSAEDRNIGGLGIFLAKQLMDHLEYRYENRQNILTLQKKITEV